MVLLLGLSLPLSLFFVGLPLSLCRFLVTVID